MEKGNYVQQWFAYEDPDAPGTTQAFSCNVMYNDTTTWINKTDVSVQNYYGEHSWDSGKNEPAYFDEINYDYIQEGPWQPFKVENDPNLSFIVGYERDISAYSQ